MKRIELYREYQRIFYGYVQSEALSHEIKEYSADVRKMRTCVTLFDGRCAVKLTFYISGRYVIERTECFGTDDFKTVLDRHSEDYIKGKSTPSLLIDETIYELLVQFIKFRKERLEKRYHELEQKLTEANAADDEADEENMTLETVEVE